MRFCGGGFFFSLTVIARDGWKISRVRRNVAEVETRSSDMGSGKRKEDAGRDFWPGAQ